eukprot:2252776-Pleurochrysis_carterae.AAC.1
MAYSIKLISSFVKRNSDQVPSVLIETTRPRRRRLSPARDENALSTTLPKHGQGPITFPQSPIFLESWRTPDIQNSKIRPKLPQKSWRSSFVEARAPSGGSDKGV